MAKRVKKQYFGSYVNIRMCRIDLSKDTNEEQIKVLEQYRPELLEDEPTTKRKPKGDSK